MRTTVSVPIIDRATWLLCRMFLHLVECILDVKYSCPSSWMKEIGTRCGAPSESDVAKFATLTSLSKRRTASILGFESGSPISIVSMGLREIRFLWR